jgi:hypothetical protein
MKTVIATTCVLLVSLLQPTSSFAAGSDERPLLGTPCSSEDQINRDQVVVCTGGVWADGWMSLLEAAGAKHLPEDDTPSPGPCSQPGGPGCPIPQMNSSPETGDSMPRYVSTSRYGNVYPYDTPIPCSSSGECVDPRSSDSAPGGLGYGCLLDVKLCGYLFPQQPVLP